MKRRNSARTRRIRGALLPVSAVKERRFRGALERRMELAGSSLTITGAEAAERKALLMRRSKAKDLDEAS